MNSSHPLLLSHLKNEMGSSHRLCPEHGHLSGAIREIHSLLLIPTTDMFSSDVGRTLSGATYDNATSNTIETCINYCSINGYVYAGTEYSSQCCMSTYPHVIDLLKLTSF